MPIMRPIIAGVAAPETEAALYHIVCGRHCGIILAAKASRASSAMLANGINAAPAAAAARACHNWP